MIWFSKGSNILPVLLLAAVFLLLARVLWAKSADKSPPAAGRPVILAYSAMWKDGFYPPEAYNYGAMTHIARAFLRPDKEGHISVPDGYFNPELARLAKANGVKLLVSLGGWSAGSDNWMSVATHAEYEKRFFDELERLVTGNRYDGIDIDWEPGAKTDEEQKAFAGFMKNLRARFPHRLLTTAVMVGEEYASHMSWKEVAACVDYINLMTYDFSGSYSRYAYHHANLYSVPGTKAEKGISVDETVRRLETQYGLDPAKTLLGVPFYGKVFFTENWNDPLPQSGPRLTYLDYAGAIHLVKSGQFLDRWDEKAQAPYLKRVQGPGMATYETPKSLALKCEYAKEKKFPGVIIWVLGSDLVGDKTPLLDQIAESFGASGKPVPLEVLPKMDQAYADSARDAFGELSGYYQQLADKGRKKEAETARPLPLPDLTVPRDSQKVTAHLESLQDYLTDTNQKIQYAKQVLGLPFE
jgi:chitinase